MEFSLATHAKMKRDIADRLAHKELYKRVEHAPEKQLELLIVVDQQQVLTLNGSIPCTWIRWLSMRT